MCWSLIKKEEIQFPTKNVRSFSSCLNQVWHIIFPNILWKKEIRWSEENVHLCKNNFIYFKLVSAWLLFNI